MNTLSNKTYSYDQVRIPKLYKCITAGSHGLIRLNGTMPSNLYVVTYYMV